MSNKQNSREYARNLFIKSATSLQAGNPVSARKGLLKVAKLLPDSAAVWYNLGLCYQYLNQHDKAVEAYKKSLKLSPNQVDGLVNIAISYKELGKSSESEETVKKAVELDPDHPRALNLLGSIEGERGEYQAAKDYLERSLRILPDNKDAILNLAILELDHEKPDRAMQIAADLIRSDPNDRQVRLLHAKILLNKKLYEEAAVMVLKLETDYPDDEDAMRLYLSYRQAIRDYFGAVAIAEKLLKRFPDDADLWNSLGGAYFQLDGIEKAKQCYETALKLNPDHPEYQNNMGLAYSTLGDKENAGRHFRRSIELNPDHAEAYRNIATMKRFKSMDDPDAVRVKHLWEQENQDDFQAIRASFALGKIYDDCGLYDQAFPVYKKGNDLKFKETRIDLQGYFGHLDRIQEVFTQPPANVSALDISPQPIFILGMPRSGTTLVEQILTRHTEVHGCGELPCIERAITRLEKKSQPMIVYPEDFVDLGSSSYEQEVEEYHAWVKRLHDIKTPYFTDKMPFNFAHVWLVKAMFPGSAIVHCQRHPLDVITSNYFQLYGSEIGFVYDLETLTNYYILYHRLMSHWQSMFGDGIYNIKYEDLVSNTETETRRLVDAVNLDWQDNCLDHAQSDTAVRTASIWQVRQGIYTRSRERWRNYEKFLGEVIDMLAEEKILDQEGNWIAWEQNEIS
jgi:tetratricopeptide (TPR) repeat protein